MKRLIFLQFPSQGKEKLRMLYRAKFLVFVGPDGSGKTSLINELEKNIGQEKNIEIKHIRFNIIPRFGKLKKFFSNPMRTKKSEIFDPTVSKVGKINNRYIYGPDIKLWKIVINLIYELLDYLLGYFFLLSKNSNAMIIFDRYFYDYYTEKNWRKNPKLFMKILMLFVPKPDYIFFLWNEPKVIKSRKPELSEEEIEFINSRILDLLAKNRNFHIVKTDKSVTDLCEQIVKLIK